MSETVISKQRAPDAHEHTDDTRCANCGAQMSAAIVGYTYFDARGNWQPEPQQITIWRCGRCHTSAQTFGEAA